MARKLCHVNCLHDYVIERPFCLPGHISSSISVMVSNHYIVNTKTLLPKQLYIETSISIGELSEELRRAT